MQSASATGSEAHTTPMPAESPLDILADELGAVAGRIERELRQAYETYIAKLEARVSALDLHVHKAETERGVRISERLAIIRDGRDGIDGKDGLPGQDGQDGAPGRDGIDGLVGKDGAPGRDGADGKDGEPGPPGEIPYAPESVSEHISRAIASLSQSPPVSADILPFVLNINANSDRVKKKTITMRKDRDGNPIADVVEG